MKDWGQPPLKFRERIGKQTPHSKLENLGGKMGVLFMFASICHQIPPQTGMKDLTVFVVEQSVFATKPI
jgi:hypothetical protein